MEKIQYSDINFGSLEKLKSQGTKSTIYRDNDKCIKVLDGVYPEEKTQLMRKFNDMSGISISNVLLPKELIIKDGMLYGYTMDYFGNSMPLSDRFLVRYFNCKDLFEYVYKASNILRNIHDNGIILQDLSFENILVDDNGNVKYCDLDGCSYGKHVGPFISLLLKNFYIDYRKQRMNLNENLDRISMMISFFMLTYGRSVQNLSKKQYHSLSDQIKTLENIREYANMLVNRDCSINNIPYLDELIDLSDDYLIDRKKQLTLKQRILRK